MPTQINFFSLKALVVLSEDDHFDSNSVTLILKNHSLKASKNQKLSQSISESPCHHFNGTLKIITACSFISGDEGSQHLHLIEKLIEAKLFSKLEIANKTKLLNFCNDYFSQDSSIVLKDFLERNYMMVKVLGLISSIDRLTILSWT